MGKAAFLATQWGLEKEGGTAGQGPTKGHCSLALCLHPHLYLQQVAVAIGPRAEAQEPFSGAQWGRTDCLGEIGER